MIGGIPIEYSRMRHSVFHFASRTIPGGAAVHPIRDLRGVHHLDAPHTGSAEQDLE